MNKSDYGKTMENLRKIINVRLVNNAKDYLKYVSKPTFISQKKFSKNFGAIHEVKPVLVLNKPIYVGFSVLELSKYLTYNFHYNFIKKKLDAELLLTDTDNLYEELFKYKHVFDFSEYISNFFDSTNEKVIGEMKDEFKGIPINKFIGLK